MKSYRIALSTLAFMLLQDHILAEDDIGLMMADEQLSRTSIDEQEEDETTNRYIVKFKAGSHEFEERMNHARRKLSSGLRRTAMANEENAFLTYGSFLPKDYAEVVYLNSEEEIKEWSEKDEVEYIEPDSKVYPLEWEHEDVPYGITNVHALDVSDEFVANRKVCITDTGYTINHPDLPNDPSIVTGYSGPNSAGDWDKDGHGHGTHVAGTIAAIGGNNKGVVGVNRNGQLNLHIVKVFNDNGQYAWRSGLIAAVEECVKAGANVVNMSLGGPNFSQIESDAYKRILHEDNVLVVASAGNGRGGLEKPNYPAFYEHVLSVAAVDSDNVVAYFSTRNSQVDIAAPGVYVKSTVPWSDERNSWYAKFSGTSMAAPHVAGIAALVWSHDTSKTAIEIDEILKITADDLGDPGRDNLYGFGLVRADKAKELVTSEYGYTFAPSAAHTDQSTHYCNYRGCDGERQGGEWCNVNKKRCIGECAGEWCAWIPSPPTSSPTKTPTSSPIPTFMPSSMPTSTPTLSPSSIPTVQHTNMPSSDPTSQPTPCQDVATDQFFFKNNTSTGRPVYKTCEWLASLSDERQVNICTKKTDSHGGYGPANEVCRKACETCDPTSEPSTIPSQTPSLEPTELPSMTPTRDPSDSPSKGPTNVPTQNPTRSGPCCSQDFRTCPSSIPEWCSQTESNCQQCGGTLITGAPLQCLAKWSECTWNTKGCCSPSTCQGDQYFKQCLA